MKQLEIAQAFEEIADILEVKGENPFRIRAYRRAALSLRGLAEEIEQKAAAGRLTDIPGIGKDLSEKIDEYLSTGRLGFLSRLKEEIPAGVSALMSIPGVGPKTARLLFDKFKVRNVGDLKRLVHSGKLRSIPGFQRKKEENILHGIELLKAGQERMNLGAALALSREFVEALEGFPGVKRIAVAGSLRRSQETVRDIDILIASASPQRVMGRFVTLPFVREAIAHGRTKSSIRTRQGAQVDLRVVEPDAFGAALVYFTGSKAHNIKIRGLANRLGLTINEYGVFRIKGNKRVAGCEEKDVYEALGLPWIPPELREDRGEIEAAAKGSLPRLVDLPHLRGDFHIHSDWSDGHHPIEEVAWAAKKRGYEYMLLSDHSKSLRVAGGLTEKELRDEMEEVKKLNKKLAPFTILMGAEVDILPSGKLDYADRTLAGLDMVIASVHSAFKQSEPVMTRRVVRALQNPYVSILGHPTTRLLGARGPIAADFEEIIRQAACTKTALEINCQAQRLDLNDQQARRARQGGAMLALATDTHSIDQLRGIELGVGTARRAWLGPGDLLNTLTLRQLREWVQRKRKGMLR